MSRKAKCPSVLPNLTDIVDLVSIVKANWADIGVDLKLDTREWGIYLSIANGHKHKEIIVYSLSPGIPDKALWMRQGGRYNMSKIDEAYLNERLDKIWSFENVGNEAEKNRLLKEMGLRGLDQVYMQKMTGRR